MGDILSQKEIDDLLKALSTGEIDAKQIQTTTQEKKVKLHDFKTSNKYAKDHIKTLTFIHEHFARLVTNFLSGYLRAVVQVDLFAVEPLQYLDFSNAISNPAMIGVVEFAPLPGSILFEMAPQVAYALIDRILGGKGSAMERIRNFTEIERAIIERIMTQILNLMREPWENVAPIRPRLERTENNAQFTQIVAPNEAIALITLNTKVGETEGLINICIPYNVIEPVISKLSTRLWFSPSEKAVTEETKRALETKIQSTKVPIKAILGRTTLTVNDFIDLQKGDVIPLDTGVNNDIEILVGDHLKFMAKPGVKKNKTSVKITEVLRREEE